MAAISVIFVFAVFVGYAVATLPNYIHVCHRNDPEVTKCIIQSVEVLRPRLRDGIPELDVPSIEPLQLPEVVISRGTSTNYRAIGKNVNVYGLSNFQVQKLKLNIPETTFYIGVKFTSLKFLTDVDVNLRLLTLPVKGQGKLQANATNCVGNVILKGELITEDNVEKMKFTSADLDLHVDDISVHVDNIFGGDAALGQAINQALTENKQQIFSVIKPVAEETVSKILLDMVNKIVKNFAYNEVFPE